MPELLTLGYSEPNAQQRLDAFMARPQTMLIDIRFNPRSRWYPAFNQKALIERYGVLKYRHCKELGNSNYNKPGEAIKLWKPEEGIQSLLFLWESMPTLSLILLCACKNYERCHRKTVYELFQSHFQSQTR